MFANMRKCVNASWTRLYDIIFFVWWIYVAF